MTCSPNNSQLRAARFALAVCYKVLPVVSTGHVLFSSWSDALFRVHELPAGPLKNDLLAGDVDFSENLGLTHDKGETSNEQLKHQTHFPGPPVYSNRRALI